MRRIDRDELRERERERERGGGGGGRDDPECKTGEKIRFSCRGVLEDR